ncbi:MAG: hypothetical protein ACI4F2_09510 [Acutalibacteraceae bacterium]
MTVPARTDKCRIGSRLPFKGAVGDSRLRVAFALLKFKITAKYQPLPINKSG